MKLWLVRTLDANGNFDLIQTMIKARKKYSLDLTEAANFISFVCEKDMKKFATPERIIAGKAIAERLQNV